MRYQDACLFRSGSKTVFALALIAAVMIAPYGTGAEDERKIAESLAEFLRSARAVIGSSQPLINRASAEDKGLTGDEVVRRAVEIYRETTGTDPLAIDPASREGELLRAQMAAVREVMDENQTTINNPSLGFKGFVPAVFGRMVSERFSEKVGDRAEIKVTAPTFLVRNRDRKSTRLNSSH